MENVMTAIRLVPLDHYLILSFLLFSIGMVGALVRRNIIIVIMCLELMLNSVNLLLVAFSAYHSDPGGQIMVFFIMLVAAAEVTVGLAILVLLKRNTNGVDMNQLNRLKW
ncbi:MAG: NADH-quinone oxidoreductase subunit NuoK [Flavobacteriales bacterium]|nr:NADH-quinone oxidoreductase subunit NuoK [Flavobacteriales bacterium]MBK6891894.1 NADH-quinone oxidoreductase subunit NuoK [Flavobacteriales bacterium]MBK7247124.1 NADH-quinone oxidoreductase subunit NuoK [Flavobacteriales bacterium]MBK7288737.1 NADH-quinone oxidoreductase subunit NuoK [Flavobacteriales bacterium]MBK9060206.1 NADH-quinone oxidoreductase subunit NuoK [Flavobacteriales bacterium]